MAPRDIAPADMVRMPLVHDVIGLRRGVVHSSARVVHPSCRGQDMELRSPSVEQSVVAQSIEVRSGFEVCGEDGTCARKSNKRRKTEAEGLHDDGELFTSSIWGKKMGKLERKVRGTPP